MRAGRSSSRPATTKRRSASSPTRGFEAVERNATIARTNHIFDESSWLPEPPGQPAKHATENRFDRKEGGFDPKSAANRFARRRGIAVSDELRKSARALRGAASNKSVPAWPHRLLMPWRRISAPALDYRRFTAVARRRPRLVTLIGGCLIPAVVVVGYLGFVMSDQYTSEAQFATLGAASISSDPISKLAGLSAFQETQDTLIVVNYILSPAIVAELEQTVGLGERFSRGDIDWLSRFHADQPFEKLVKYWRKQIKLNVESPSGIITVKVSAFSPQDAFDIASAVAVACEKMVNTISMRAVRDATAEAESELERAQRRLQDVRVALQDLRNAQSTLNPRRTADGLGKLIAELRLERARLEDDASAAKLSKIEESAPQMQLLRVRIEVISNQISDLERQITGTADAKSAATLSDKMTSFDQLETDHQIAEKQYTAAFQTFERARLKAESKKVYLTTFVPPLLPHDVAWPSHRLLIALLGAAAVAAAYWIATRVVARVFGYPI
jgi:capsular polysaccharide transport system permease protein